MYVDLDEQHDKRQAHGLTSTKSISTDILSSRHRVKIVGRSNFLHLTKLK